jgi:pilus assembly protein CpaB
MRYLLIGLILLAVATAGGAALMVKRLMDSRIEERANIPVEKIEAKGIYVIVADERIPIGTTLTKGFLRWQKWPNDAIQSTFLSSEARDGKLVKKLVGATVRQRVAEGTPITEDMVFRRGKTGFLSGIIDEGFRAIALKIDIPSGVGGFILPGDRVDVLVTFNARQLTQGLSSSNTEGGLGEDSGPRVIGHAKYSSETILQDVRVLGIDQKFKEVEDNALVAKSATLEVSPKQAEILTVARAMGKLSLTLRSKANDGSGTIAKSYTTDVGISPTLQNIMARIAKDAQRNKAKGPLKRKRQTSYKSKPAAPPSTEVRIIRGDNQSTQKFLSR